MPSHETTDTRNGGDAALARRIRRIRNALAEALARDRRRIRSDLNKLTRRMPGGEPSPAFEKRLTAVEARLADSRRQRKQRMDRAPQPAYPAELPIVARKDDIVAAIRRHPVVIVSGETGSGKTTQLPKFCLEAGRGIDGRIGCTQPRRIAAITVAARIAEELGDADGHAVGYKIRFSERMQKDAYIKIMTDGILLAEAQSDRWLNEYDTIIVDEAHERSLNIDFLLGILKTLIRRRRDLKLVITSATIDTEKFSAAFDSAPVIEVSGRMYPVEVVYAPADGTDADAGDETCVDLAVRALDRLTGRHRWDDVLIFMPTEQDIRETCDLLDARYRDRAEIFPLFARLPAADQSRVFRHTGRRKIIVATNVAETSITIPGIRYVIDTGLARISRYSPRSRTTSLPISPISRSSADQRMGRCGRVENGVCIRLYAESDYANRPRFTAPEILRTNLAEVILRMMALRLGDIADFPFIDRPADKSIADGFGLLTELGAIRKREKRDDATRNGPYALTERGRMMAHLPIDPRLSRMLLAARELGCLEAMLIIASALSIRDPRERPAEKADAADRMHRQFTDPASDFTAFLNLWGRYRETLRQGGGTSRIKKFCKTHFLSYVRMREWRDIHTQLREILKEAGLYTAAGKTADRPWERADHTAVHQAVLTGFLSNIAVKKEKNLYTAARGRQAMLFPGSGLFNAGGQWIVAAEMVETSRLFARTVGNIDSTWLEALGGDLCRRTYLNPHWERNRGEVVAMEQVTLFGLVIVGERSVSYGCIDPDRASEIFIQNALVAGDVKQPPGFIRHNQALIDDVRDMENRVRRRDILVDESDLFAFYRERLGSVFDMRTLNHRIKKAGNDRFLRMNPADLLRYRPADHDLAQYPDRVALGNRQFECLYRFDPGTPDDGLTIRIPAHEATLVPADDVDWLVPGLYREKVAALIKGLPKTYRKRLVPLSDTVEIVVDEMPRNKGPLVNALGRFIHRRFAVDIPAAAWSEDLLPEHLRARLAITGPRGEELRAGRDKAILQRETDACFDTPEMDDARRQWERSGLTTWDMAELPESILLELKGGRRISVFVALVPETETPPTAAIRLFRERDKALKTHPKGVAALMCRHFAAELKFLKKSIRLPEAMKPAADAFGGSRQVEARIYDRVVATLFERDIRTRKAYDDRIREAEPMLMAEGRRLTESAGPVLEAFLHTRNTLSQLAAARRGNPHALAFLSELDGQMRRLVPDNFLDLYTIDRIGHLPRYLKAVAVRAQRAMIDMEKDRARSAELKPFTDRLQEVLAALTPETSREKRSAVEDFHWMLEEYKVSLFAQELKTAVPVSQKRLEKSLEIIGRIV